MKISNLKSQISNARRAAGFTMVEIALCLGIIAFALVAIIGVLPTGLSVQKDNREDTAITFDAAYLMDVIKNGARGQDDLTNYILGITVNSYAYSVGVNTTNLLGTYIWGYTNDSIGNPKFFVPGTPLPAGLAASLPIPTGVQPFLTGSNLVGMLSTPKYIFNNAVFTSINPADTATNYQSLLSTYYPANTTVVSNYVVAYLRAINDTASQAGTSQSARDFAFKYRVIPEIVPFDPGVYDENWTNYDNVHLPIPGGGTNDPVYQAEYQKRFNNFVLSKNFRGNMNQIRLSFAWPLYPNGNIGNSRQTYRTTAGGTLAPQYLMNGFAASQNAPLYFVQPQTFTAQ